MNYDLDPAAIDTNPIEDDIEAILSDISPGWKVSIRRLSPGYCRGHLETLEIDPQTPVSLDYLRDTWGGAVLKLQIKDPKGKIRRSVDVQIDAPPKRWGKRHRDPDDYDERPQPTQAIQLAPQQNTSENFFLGLLELMQSNNAQNMQFVTSALTSQQRQAAVETNPAAQLLSLAETIKTLQDLFPQREPESDSLFGADGLSTALVELLKAYNSKNSPSPSPPAPRPSSYRQPTPRHPPTQRQRTLNPPSTPISNSLNRSEPAFNPPSPPPPAPPAASPPAPPASPASSASTTPRDLAVGLARLSASEIAETVEIAFAEMSEEKRAELFGMLMNVPSFEGEDVDQDEEEDFDDDGNETDISGVLNNRAIVSLSQTG